MFFLDLFRPKWKHSNCYVRLNATEKLEDNEILREIAQNDKDWTVRKCAFEKLGDKQLAITEVIRNSCDLKECITSVRMLTNLNILTDIMNNDARSDVRTAAFENIAGFEIARIYKKLSLNDREKRVEAASELINIAKNDPERISLIWDKIAKVVETPHKSSHNDFKVPYNRYEHNSCDYADGGHYDTTHTDEHTDTGIGLKFPQFPPNLHENKQGKQ